jgi:hypothetical protein
MGHPCESFSVSGKLALVDLIVVVIQGLVILQLSDDSAFLQSQSLVLFRG